MMGRLPRSLMVGLAARVALISAVLGAGVFALLYGLIAQFAQDLALQTIDTDVEALADQLATHGQATLIARLEDRMALQPSERERSYYLLTGPTGTVLAGNMAGRLEAGALAGIDPATSQSGMVRLAGETHPIAVRATVLMGGLRLYDGLTMRGTHAMLGRLRWIFAGALALLASGTFLTGLLASRRMRRRLGMVTRELAALAGQPLAADSPVPVERRGDEIADLQAALAAIGDRIAALLAAQRDVADNIAHETRTPLIVVEARLADILEHSRDPVVLGHAEQARHEARALVRLLDALLDIASVEAQRGSTQGLDEVSLSEICSSIAELYRPSIAEAGMTLVCEIAPDVRLAGDAMQLSRLLVNLLDNALKHGAGGHEIRLTLAPGPVLAVQDQGEGIAPEERDAIFVRYARGRARTVRGHGLGLPLVKAIASRHGLVVRVEDGEGRADTEAAGGGDPRPCGTRFVVGAPGALPSLPAQGVTS